MSGYEGTYALRVHRLATVDMIEAYERLAEATNEDYAADWYIGLQKALATLATLPKRGPVAEEDRLFRRVEVKVVPYRHGSGRVVHHVFYSVHEPGEDAPFVHILHVRHGARKPMTRAEARKIEAED